MRRQLQFQGEKSPSFAPKAAITSWYFLAVAGAAWLTLSAPEGVNLLGSPGRRVALLVCVGIYVVRAGTTLSDPGPRRLPRHAIRRRIR